MRRCTMAETLTEKQRVAVEALEGARRAGVPLSDYAKSKGLEMRPVYDAIAALRRRRGTAGDRPAAQAQEQVCSGAGEELAGSARRGRGSGAQRHGVPAGVRARMGDRVWRVATAELAVGGAARS